MAAENARCARFQSRSGQIHLDNLDGEIGEALYRRHVTAWRATLLRFLIPGSSLQGDRVVPAFKPPFDIIHRIAQEARARAVGRHSLGAAQVKVEAEKWPPHGGRRLDLARRHQHTMSGLRFIEVSRGLGGVTASQFANPILPVLSVDL